MSTITHREENVARVNQSCLTADIWLRAECCNTIPDRSKGQIRNCDAREWHEGGMGSPLYTRHIVKGHSKGQVKLNTLLS